MAFGCGRAVLLLCVYRLGCIWEDGNITKVLYGLSLEDLGYCFVLGEMY
jgi:hypothetical protein